MATTTVAQRPGFGAQQPSQDQNSGAAPAPAGAMAVANGSQQQETSQDSGRAAEAGAEAAIVAATTRREENTPEARARRLTGTQHAAVLLIAIGAEASSEALKHMPEPIIERLTEEIVKLGQVRADVTDAVLERFANEVVLTDGDRVVGGLEQARAMLTEALGARPADELIDRITSRIRRTPFWFLHDVDAGQLLNFIQYEHPQTIALILAHLPPALGARILTGLPAALQSDVPRRVATLEPATLEVIRGVEDLLSRKMAAATDKRAERMGGVDHVVSMLNAVDRTIERSVMDELDENQPDLADEIRRNMLRFDDLVSLGDRDVQRVNREIDTSDLALALRGASDPLRQLFYKNMSQRAAADLQDNIEFLGPTPLSQIEEAQQRVITAIRRLEQAEEITLARGGSDQMV